MRLDPLHRAFLAIIGAVLVAVCLVCWEIALTVRDGEPPTFRVMWRSIVD